MLKNCNKVSIRSIKACKSFIYQIPPNDNSNIPSEDDIMKWLLSKSYKRNYIATIFFGYKSPIKINCQ